MKIIVYGNSDTRPKYGFPTEKDFIRYIEKDIFDLYKSHYHYSQNKDADVIILSRKGKAYGYFKISGTEPPNDEDFKVADTCKKVYLVEKSILFKKPVYLKELAITGYQFGKSITEKQFEEIKTKAGDAVIN